MEVESKLKSIPGFDGYKASSEGEIYSFKKVSPKKLRKQLMSSGRYYFVSLRKNNRCFQIGVHRLVCMAFTNMTGEGLETSHINGNSLDNRATNLRFESRAENLRRRIGHGTDDAGTKNSRAKFSKKDLSLIKKLCANGISQKEVAKRFNCAQQTISKVITGSHYARD